MDALTKALALAETARAREKERRISALDDMAAKNPVQLSFWPSDVRGIPNILARSAIFTVRRCEKRMFLTDSPIFALGNVRITYTGPELRAKDDQLVWLQILDYAHAVALGRAFEFTIYQLLKDIGWGKNSYYYSRVRSSILRLLSAVLAIETNVQLGQWFSAHMIEYAEVYGDKILIRLHPNIQEWFLAGHTWLPWSTYRKLSPTARRLIDYATSHSDPYPLRVDTVHQMLGSDSSTAAFKNHLRDTFHEIEGCGVRGYFKGELVCFGRHKQRKKLSERRSA